MISIVWTTENEPRAVGAAGLERRWTGVHTRWQSRECFFFLANTVSEIIDLDLGFWILHQCVILSEFQHNQHNKGEMRRQWVFRFSYIVKNNFHFQFLGLFSFINGIDWGRGTEKIMFVLFLLYALKVEDWYDLRCIYR